MNKKTGKIKFKQDDVLNLEELVLNTSNKYFDHQVLATKHCSVENGTLIYDMEKDGAFWPVRVPERIGAGGSVSIEVEYEIPGTFAIQLICISGKVIPQIGVDDKLQTWDVEYREDGSDNWDMLSVEIPSGHHIITINNTSLVESWLHIKSYHFGQYLSGRYRLMVIPPEENARIQVSVNPKTGNKICLHSGGIGYQGELRFNGHYIGSFMGPVETHLAASALYVKDIRCEYNYYIKPEMTAGAEEGEIELIVSDRHDTRYKSGPCILQSIELSELSADFSLPIYTPQPIVQQVKIASNKRYFYLENGQSYFPVGITLWSPVSGSTAGLKNCPVGPYWCENDPEITYRWLEKLAAFGMNNIRIVTASTAFIRKIGEINMEKVELLDKVIQHCKKLGLYVVISLEDHYNLRLDTETKTPLREITRRGKTEREQRTLFFSDPVIRKQMVDFAKCLAERYKNENTVMAYELMDEVWFAGYRGDPSIIDYHQDLANAIRSITNRQLISTSVLSWIFNGKIVDTWNDLLAVKELDFLSFEAYEDWGWSITKTMKYLYHLSSLGRPAFYGESNWYSNPLFFWQRSWCTVFSGGMGVRPWNYISEAHMMLLSPLIQFTQKFRWADINPRIGFNSDNRVQSNANNIRYIADNNGSEIAVWVEGNDGTTVQVNGLTGTYTLEWFDPWDGRIAEKIEVTINEGIKTKLPDLGIQNAMVLHLWK